jgi:hypothetical protein
MLHFDDSSVEPEVQQSEVDGIPQWLMNDIVNYAHYKRNDQPHHQRPHIHRSRPFTANCGGEPGANHRKLKANSRMSNYVNWSSEIGSHGAPEKSHEAARWERRCLNKEWISDVKLKEIVRVNNEFKMQAFKPSKPADMKPSNHRARDRNNLATTDLGGSTEYASSEAAEVLTVAAADAIAARRRMLIFYAGVSYLARLQQKKNFLWTILDRSFKRLQQNFRYKRQRAKYSQSTIVLSMCLMFRIQLRVWRKCYSANLVTKFIVEHFATRTQVVIRKYLRKVRVCQRTIRAFLIVNRARVALVECLWEKLEKQLLQQIDRREEKAEVQRQKEVERQIAKADSTGLHLKWMLVESRVRRLMTKMNKVQNDAQSFERAVERFARMKQNTADVVQPAANQRGQLSRRKDDEDFSDDLVDAHLGHVDRDTRKRIIREHIRSKRKKFIEKFQQEHGLSLDTHNKQGK